MTDRLPTDQEEAHEFLDSLKKQVLEFENRYTGTDRQFGWFKAALDSLAIYIEDVRHDTLEKRGE